MKSLPHVLGNYFKILVISLIISNIHFLKICQIFKDRKNSYCGFCLILSMASPGLRPMTAVQLGIYICTGLTASPCASPFFITIKSSELDL